LWHPSQDSSETEVLLLLLQFPLAISAAVFDRFVGQRPDQSPGGHGRAVINPGKLQKPARVAMAMNLFLLLVV